MYNVRRYVTAYRLIFVRAESPAQQYREGFTANEIRHFFEGQ